MGTLAVFAEEHFSVSPEEAFALFGSASSAGWVFGAKCDRVVEGATITMRVPFDGPLATPFDILGRIDRIQRPSRIQIHHHQPWRGSLRIQLDPVSGGTRVRLVGELDHEGLDWLMRRRGLPIRERAVAGSTPIGLLTTKSGPASMLAAATDYAAMLAIDQINGDGGVNGRPLRLVIGDDRTDPAIGVAEARRLARAGCRTILVATTSATFAAIAEAFEGTGILVVQTLMNEGGLSGPLRVQFGERPENQLRLAAKPLMRRAGGNRWFLAGNDYCWPKRSHQVARQALPGLGGVIVGERVAPIGTQDFEPLIHDIEHSGADLILSTFVGADSAAFERQCHKMGLRRRCMTLSMAMDESTLERIGADASEGIWATSGYFEALATPANRVLTTRYRDAFGRLAPPLSTMTESTFEALLMYADAARRARSDEPADVARELHSGSFELPRGTVSTDGRGNVRQALYLAQAHNSTLQVADAA